ncbi:LytR/AlgR family response regulator transcription factor [Sphingomonas flavalba]|uniref:LytR/AlgR family response regulator transcription factor n=1 Tax=Sphingomonas flavalba TaxID=2559804 RepID=UPI00109DAFF2|nr:LytTR family DNA-binding domain-containing protein [Sphingomonas flavalba]
MAADPAPLRTLIVDDEPLAVERLQLLCAREPAIALVGTATDGDGALRMVEALEPDLLLLDIAMPERDGMSVARALGQAARRPAIIFVTAFDGFAVEAFDLAAVDYLLKPVAADRLSRAVARAVAARAEAPAGAAEDGGSAYVNEFWVPHRAELVRIAAEDIERIDAERDYMRLHVGQRSFLLHQTISALEARLDPERFIRLHRSTIIRRDRIVKLRHDGSGVWYADLADGTAVRIGRTYLATAKALAGR